MTQIRVIGRATFQISRDLREFGTRAKPERTTIVVDLSSCEGMDSTFLGVLAMIGLNAGPQATLVIVNASPGHRKLLQTIGLTKIWALADKTVADVNWRSLCNAATDAMDMQNVGPVVLAAHQALMQIDPQNVPKFKDVVELLSSEIDQPSKKEVQG